MSERLEMWMDAYLEAWSDLIAALFSPDAIYDPQTADGERHGLQEIVDWWRGIGDDPDNWDFEWLPLVETGDIAVVTGATHYLDPEVSYRNLFVIKFDDSGLCRDFTEWYIEEGGP